MIGNDDNRFYLVLLFGYLLIGFVYTSIQFFFCDKSKTKELRCFIGLLLCMLFGVFRMLDDLWDMIIGKLTTYETDKQENK